MRHVSNSREIAHWWANQTQDDGRTGNGHLFFDKGSIYSYGWHFEIARHVVPAPKDAAVVAGTVVLFTTRTYSNSTAKHKLHVRRALNHKTVFDVPSFEDHAENARYYLAAVETAHGAALRAVTAGKVHEAQAKDMARTGAEYVKTFARKIPAKLRQEVYRVAELAKTGRLFTAAELAKLAAAESRRTENERKRAEKSAADRAAWEAGAPERALNQAHADAVEENKDRNAPEILDAWARGASDELPSWRRCEELGTRLRLKDNRIETSRGARITRVTAVLLWRALTTGAPVVGQKLDGYQIDAWDGAVLTVGCHELRADELARMAQVLELPGTLPAAVSTGGQ